MTMVSIPDHMWILFALPLLFLPVSVQAETKIITAESTYTMGDGETPSIAEAMVLQKAKQAALEQAGTYVESYTKVLNLDLTAEEIQTIAGGVIQVEVLDKSRTLIGEGLRFYVKINATVTTDKMEELAQRIKGKNVAEEYEKLQERYAQLSRNLESLKQLLARTPPGPERDAALKQIHEQEKEFTSTQQQEQTIFQQLAEQSASQLSVKRSQRETVEDFMHWMVAHGYQVASGKPTTSTSLDKPDQTTVTIPISVAMTQEARTRLQEMVKQLGGDEDALEDSLFRPSVPNCGFSSGRLPPVTRPVVVSPHAEPQQRLVELVRAQVLTFAIVKTDGSVLKTIAKRGTDHNLESRRCTVATERPGYRLLTPQSYGPSRGVTHPSWNPLWFPLYPNSSGASLKFNPAIFMVDEPVEFQIAELLLVESVAAIQGVKWRVSLNLQGN